MTSLTYATVVAITSSLAGVLIAVLLWRLRDSWVYKFRWFVLILVAVPPYVHALSWMSLLGIVFNIVPSGWVVITWVQVMAMLPIAVGITLVGLEGLDQQITDVARVYREDIYVLRDVLLPLLLPAITSSMFVIFLLTFADYSVPSAFQENVYSLELFAEYSASADPVSVLLLSFPVLMISFIVIWLLSGRLRAITQIPGFTRDAKNMKWEFPVWISVLLWITFGMIAFQVLISILGLMYQAGSWGSFMQATNRASSDLIFSFQLALLTAIITVPIAGLTVLYLRHNHSRWWLFVIVMPVALPASLIGVGSIELWSRYSPDLIYGSIWLPVFVMLARFLPFAVLVVYAALLGVDKALLDAARILQPTLWKRWAYIGLPLVAPGLVAASLVVFVLSLAELGATIIVTPPGSSTLAIRIYNYLHYGAGDEVAALCLLLLMLALSGAALALFSIRGGFMSMIGRKSLARNKS